MAKWEHIVKLENSACVTKSVNSSKVYDMHYHTSFTPTEAARRWYLDNGWSIADFCHAKEKRVNLGDPYTSSMDC